MDLKELESGVNPDIHWYYQSKKLPLIAYTKKILKNNTGITIVDVGSGSGFFALSLEKQFSDEIKKIWLVDINYSEDEINETKNKKIEKTLKIPNLIENSLVIMMDVLEHLEDDYKMLNDIKSASKGDKNYFFITVPAFKSLWSGHDDYLGHYRRYKINSLSAVLKKANFSISNSYYLYGALFPFVWLVRKLDNMKKTAAQSNMKPAGNFINNAMLNFNAIEMKIAKLNKLFGITCVAEGKI